MKPFDEQFRMNCSKTNYTCNGMRHTDGYVFLFVIFGAV